MRYLFILSVLPTADGGSARCQFREAGRSTSMEAKHCAAVDGEHVKRLIVKKI